MKEDYLHKVISGYKLIDLLGCGGMGVVYRAVHLQSGKVVAIKILQQNSLKDRFINEAELHSGLKHPNIVEMYSMSWVDDKPCIIMEYVQGYDLDELIKNKGALEPDLAMNIFRQLLSAIEYLHKQDIIYRDMKPGNIKIKSTGEVKLMDFGIAKNPLSPKFTRVGFAVGTIDYMSPEQLAGSPNKQSDIWCLGILLYEMISGELPYVASDTEQLRQKIIKAKTPSLLRILNYKTPQISEIIRKCLVKNYKRRIDENKLKKLTEDYFYNKEKNENQHKAQVLDHKYIQFAKLYDVLDLSLKTFGKTLAKIVITFILLIIVFVSAVLIFSHTDTNISNQLQPFDSININVVNVPDAKIQLENGEKYSLPYILKKPKDKETTFIIKAKGYLPKRITLEKVYTRKSFDYVLEKEK
ncbi:MAG TPA: serine/threonine protein kinase [Bacteroidetes bacterium]|nr:serine/threonine protein kinase [Bacteroidota bacterium]